MTPAHDPTRRWQRTDPPGHLCFVPIEAMEPSQSDEGWRPPPEWIDDLDPAELDAAAGLAPPRRAARMAGRVGLHRAMAHLGIDPGPIAVGPSGAPQIRGELVASISHTTAMAVALAAWRGRWEVGVDIEALCPPRPDIAQAVLTDRERDLVGGGSDSSCLLASACAAVGPNGSFRERAQTDGDLLDVPQELSAPWPLVLTVFSVKEALFKALNPFGIEHLDFRDVTIEMRPRGALIVDATRPVLANTFDLTAGWRYLEPSHEAGDRFLRCGWIVTWATAAKRSGP